MSAGQLTDHNLWEKVWYLKDGKAVENTIVGIMLCKDGAAIYLFSNFEPFENEIDMIDKVKNSGFIFIPHRFVFKTKEKLIKSL